MRGGSRIGAGRKPGAKNRSTIQREQGIADSGETPLNYLLRVMRDDRAERSVRLDAAKAAAPYCHPRLAAIEHTGKDGGPIETSSDPRSLARAILTILREAETE